MRLLRTDSWNVTVQRQLSTETSVELGYVGNHGSHYMADDNPDEDMNQPSIVGFPGVPRDERRPFFPLFGWTQGFRADLNDATNDYNSLQAKFTKNMSNGWSMLAHYTFAKAKNHGNDYFWIDRNLNWGTPDWHREHQFVLAGTYELPFARDNVLLGGWQLNANVFIASGQPFNVEYRDAGQDRDTGPNRPDLVGDPEMGSGDGRTAPYFNVTPIGTAGSAFAHPAVGTFGNLERNAYTGPGWWNVDASLFKRFAFGRRALELRFEVQNVFNHANLGNPDGGIGAAGTDNPNAPISARPWMISSGTSAFSRWTCSATGLTSFSAKARNVSWTISKSALRWRGPGCVASEASTCGSRNATMKSWAGASCTGSTPHIASRPMRRLTRSWSASAANAQASMASTRPLAP